MLLFESTVNLGDTYQRLLLLITIDLRSTGDIFESLGMAASVGHGTIPGASTVHHGAINCSGATFSPI